MRPPDPAQPVLYRATRHLLLYRLGIPVFIVVAAALVAWTTPASERSALVPYLLPAVVFLAGYVFFGRHLRAASVTKEGIVVDEVGAKHLIEWTDIDWATEIWMNPPTLVVRLKQHVPLLPSWFLLLPPRERRFGWRAQPMSEFVEERVRAARAARPELALTYGPWPSRAGLTFKVTLALLLIFAGAMALATWIYVKGIVDREGLRPGTGPPISASLEAPRAALTPGRRSS